MKSRRDFNKSRRDFNSPRRDFNKSRRDFNTPRRDFNKYKSHTDSTNDAYTTMGLIARNKLGSHLHDGT